MGVVLLALVIVVGILGVEWIRANKAAVPSGRSEDPERLEQLETALSSLESRLGELEDQQRFLERLLEERPDPTALPAPEQDTQESILFETKRGEG